jgi:hypothetical protein
MMKKSIKYWKDIYLDNMYRDLETNEFSNMAKNKEVGVLGCNNGRFDAFLFIKIYIILLSGNFITNLFCERFNMLYSIIKNINIKI